MVNAQVNYKGFVYDSSSKSVLTPVRIENMTTHQGTFTSGNGFFEITASLGDYIIFSYVGYKNKIVSVEGGDGKEVHKIYLKLKAVQLQEITITKGLTPYQIDSARRASIYQDVFEYEQQKSAMSPVTSIYQKFSKKHKDLRKFKAQIVDIEKQKFIDSRYHVNIVMAMTKLPEELAREFMNAYPMEFDYARTASELEIKMWIKYNFLEYNKRK